MALDATTILLAQDRESLHALAARWFADSLSLPRALLVMPRGLGNDFAVVGDTGGPPPTDGHLNDAAT